MRFSSGRPRIAFRQTQGFENAAVEAAKDLAHQFDGAVGDEVSAVYRFATDPRVEEAGTINVPDVVGLRGRANQRRAMGETAPPKASGAEVFQASGGAENGVAPTVERREAIGEINHRGAVVIVRSPGIEKIIVDIGGSLK